MENELKSAGWLEAFSQYSEDFVKTEFPKLLDGFFDENIKQKINLATDNPYTCIDGGELFLELMKAEKVEVIIGDNINVEELRKYNALFFIFKAKEIPIEFLDALSKRFDGINVYFALIGEGDKTIKLGVRYKT